MDRVIRVGALNIVTHPHTAQGYSDLVARVRRRKKAVRIRGDRFGMISIAAQPGNPRTRNATVNGILGTFTRIDADSDWINVTTGLKAEDQDRAALENLPRNLQPNHAQHRFHFYLRTHTLFYEIGNSGHRLTPKNAESLFKRLFEAPPIVNEFGDVDVTIIPDHGALDKILSAPDIRSLRIIVSAPNPDRGAQAEQQLMGRLDRLKARKKDTTYVAERGASLQPDQELEAEAKIASRNGRVEANIRKGRRVSKVSTIDTPYVYTYEYDDRGTAEWDAFTQACDNAHAEILQNE